MWVIWSRAVGRGVVGARWGKAEAKRSERIVAGERGGTRAEGGVGILMMQLMGDSYEGGWES